MGRSKSLLVAEVKFSESKGSIHAYSDDIPGLHICGTERGAVLRDVIGGIKALYQHVHGVVIDVEWAGTPASVFQGQEQRTDVERFVMKPTFAPAHA